MQSKEVTPEKRGRQRQSLIAGYKSLHDLSTHRSKKLQQTEVQKKKIQNVDRRNETISSPILWTVLVSAKTINGGKLLAGSAEEATSLALMMRPPHG